MCMFEFRSPCITELCNKNWNEEWNELIIAGNKNNRKRCLRAGFDAVGRV